MRLVHFSDLHLGFRQFDRDTKGGCSGMGGPGGEYGRNQREVDVFETFRALIDLVIAVVPDVIVCGGDVLHGFRPSNGTILELTAGFSKLVQALPAVPVIVAAGNHDMPRTRDTAVILKLLGPMGIRVADWEARRFEFPDLDLSVLAVPDAFGMQRPDLSPDHASRYNVLVMHGEAQEARQAGSVVARGRAGKPDQASIAACGLAADGWNYVGFGHYHQYEQLGPKAYYSGSIDFTSSNPWAELDVPKGFIVQDLETDEHAFVRLPQSRSFVDLKLDADGMTSELLTDALRALLDGVAVDGAVVRIVISQCERHTFRDVDSRMLREYRKRALNLHFDVRRPEVVRVGTPRSLATGQRRTLDKIVVDFLTERFPPGSDTSLEAITRLSNQYLSDAGDGADPTPALEASVAGTP